MKQKHLVVLVAVLVGALVVALIATSARQGSVDVKDSSVLDANRVLPDFPVNEVSAFSIQDGDESLHLERKDGIWTVRERKNYPADFSQVKDFLQKIYQLEPVDHVPVGNLYDRVGVADPEDEETDNKPMVLAFTKEGDESAGKLWVGKEYQKAQASQFGSFDSTVGRYVRQPGSEDVYLVGDAFDDAKTDPSDWLDGEFIKVRKIKTIERLPKDAAFEAELKELQEKLAAEKKLEGHIYKVRSFVVDSVDKPRAELLKSEDDSAAPGAGAPGGTSGIPGLNLPPAIELPSDQLGPLGAPPADPEGASAPEAKPEAAPDAESAKEEAAPKAEADQ